MPSDQQLARGPRISKRTLQHWFNAPKRKPQPEARNTANNMQQLSRALSIKRSLGTAVAARYLRDRNWSLQATLWLLLGVAERS